MNSDKDYYFIYPRDKEGKRTGQTICIYNKMEDNKPKSFYGIATCSKEDQFEYIKGRSLALERALAAYEHYIARKVQPPAEQGA